MNTPSHLILNLAILRRSQAPWGTWPILWGALVPDLAMFVFYAWAKWGEKLPEAVIWREAYYSQPWQDVFAVGNSVPLALAGLALSLGLKRLLGALFFASMGLHHLGDLPLHHDDAHRHFWPFSETRIISPVSYWDPDHWGVLGALLELALLLAASAYLWPRIQSRVGRGLMGLVCALMLTGYMLSYSLG